MKSFKKTMLIFGGAVLLIGIILSIIGLSLGGSTVLYINKSGIHTSKDLVEYKQPKTPLGDINKVNISTNLCDIEIIKSDGYYIEYSYIGENTKESHRVENGELIYEEPDSNNTWNISYFNFGDYNNSNTQNYIKLYIPEDASFEDFTINSSSGDVNLSNFDTNTLSIDASYGDVSLKNINTSTSTITLSSGDSSIEDFKVQTLDYSNSYGDANFKRINSSDHPQTTNADDNITLSLSSGDISMDKVNTNSLTIDNSYGDVSLNNINTNSFSNELSSGSLDITSSFLGNMDIYNSYGDVDISLSSPITSYDYDITCDFGDIEVDGREFENEVHSLNNHTYTIKINVSSGDVDLDFADTTK